MVDWKTFAINDLRDYPSSCQALENLNDKLAEIEQSQYSIRSSSLSAVPLHGGGNKNEDKVLNNIATKDALRSNKREVARRVERVKRGLSVLNDEEYFILDTFYMNRPINHVQKVRERLFVESDSDVYRHKEKALRKFTIAMYGLTES